MYDNNTNENKKGTLSSKNVATGMKQMTLPTRCCCNQQTAIKNMAIVTRAALDNMTTAAADRKNPRQWRWGTRTNSPPSQRCSQRTAIKRNYH